MVLGCRQGYVNTPFWLPEVMGGLCARALEAGIEVAYVRNLIRSRHLIPDPPPVTIESWPWCVRIYTLGRFSLVRGEMPLRFTGKVQRRPLDLLKLLIASGAQDVPETTIGDALWPEADGDDAQRALATTLHRLRALIGDRNAITIQGGRISLNPQCCWIDVVAFQHLLAEAHEADCRSDTAQAMGGLERALALYRGHFLDGEAEAGWVISCRSQLQRAYLRATMRLGALYEGAQTWLKACEHYERALDLSPCSEELYQRLIYCCGRAGQRAEALLVYERCRLTLAATLGVTPSPATEKIRRALLDDDGAVTFPSVS